MSTNSQASPCQYNERRIVFIMLGLSNSGKTTQANALKTRFESKGLKSEICSTSDFIDKSGSVEAKDLELAENWCQEKFLSALTDVKIRRIFVDNNNLDPKQRQYYIDECEKRDIEWVIVSVGRYTNQFAEECYRRDSGADWATFRRELQLWGEYYRKALADIELIKSKGYQNARMMRGDTRLVATRITDQGREVVFGIKADGSYIRAFIFKDAEAGLREYGLAMSTEHRVDKSLAKMTVGRRYNGSLIAAN